MSDAEHELDGSTERSWVRFGARLTDRLVGLDDGEVLVVEAESGLEDDDEGSRPYVQFCAWGPDVLRCEVSSNEYLAERHRLDDAAVEAVLALGWAAPTTRRGEPPDDGSGNYFVDVGRWEARRLATMAGSVLREVFGVLHPAFLAAEGLMDEAAAQSLVVADPRPLTPAAVFPRDHDHLQALVDEALTSYLGHPPVHDEDGDVPVVDGRTLTYVRVKASMPALELFTCVVRDVEDLEQAAAEVALLNQGQVFPKFLLVEDNVLAYLHIPAHPFAAEHLGSMLATMSSTVREVEEELARSVGGHRLFDFGEDEPTEKAGADDLGEPDDIDGDGVGTELVHQTLSILEELAVGSVGLPAPELLASVCGMDRALVLRLIGWYDEQDTAAQRSRNHALDVGDAAGAVAHDDEAAQAQQMVDLFRRALRLLVDQQVTKDFDGQGYALTRRSPSRPGRDVALPGLGPVGEEPGLFDQP